MTFVFGDGRGRIGHFTLGPLGSPEVENWCKNRGPKVGGYDRLFRDRPLLPVIE